METNQTQKSGSNSVNIQTQNLNISNGLSYSEAKEVAQDVFDNNFYRLSNTAREIAENRASELVNDFLHKLHINSPIISDSINDPDFQYVLFEAQKQYARNGNVQIKELLVNVLTKRINTPSILDIVICNEAIISISKLTNNQLIALELIYTLTVQKPSDLATNVKEHLIKYVLPIVNKIKIEPTDLEHLLYASCCNKESIKNYLADIYQKAFPQEFTSHDPNGYIILQCPDIHLMFPLWHSSIFCQLSLTSVGKYIGQLLSETEQFKLMHSLD